ncbi:sigma-70 family RNA polymerase sigma factor [Alicyclobacillus contaminans]|uniref:sigma-70 family RNA polymerase sigma factor n=1 Tax=Alicyclobacillus contaminans TaxID=392016 RepID=UPI001FDF70D7|nr:sigma-70 family RNA polymerase sigma factor [Alicyclobacillus contaminans]
MEVSLVVDSSSASPEDLQELERWMDLYGRDVMNTAYAYVKNYHQAQDITQDVFLRAFVKRDTFRGQSSIRTWLLTITVNRCKDHLRSWAQRHEIQDDGSIVYVESLSDTERQAMARVERDELWRALGQLPVKLREVLVLYYLQDLSGREIAQVLKTTEANVRTRLRRARQQLKEIFEARGEVDV